MILGALFSDHAVLQRGKPVPVWGWTIPGTLVNVSFAGADVAVMAGPDGKFMATLPAMSAGGPFELVVTPQGDWGKLGGPMVCRDVYVGEVWLASGQSNMEWTLAKLGEAGEREARDANPMLRMATVPQCPLDKASESSVRAPWRLMAPPESLEFSAVGHYFAKAQQEKLGCAVGVINSSWGGTVAEVWIGSGAPAFREASNRVPSPLGNAGLTLGWATPGHDDSAWEAITAPSTWNKAGHDHSGVFWFRKSFDAPADWAGKDLLLDLGCIDKHDIAYFNGERVGATGKDWEQQYYNVPRRYRVPGALVKAGRNVVAVRVVSFLFDGGMGGPSDLMRCAPADGGAAVRLDGPWRLRMERHDGECRMVPGVLYKNMIYPLAPYALQGVIWYQGESNEVNPRDYARLQLELIRGWRELWGQGDFPFIITQLANFREPKPYDVAALWVLLREAQRQALDEPNVGMACAIDIGEADNVHPVNKTEVGRRLALWAFSLAHGLPGVCSGPLFSRMSKEGRGLRLHFDHVGGGLRAKGGALGGFYVAGPDRQFVPAQAVIDGATVLLGGVDHPEAVRYAWADNPAGANLQNAEGLPASPFRSDNWD